MKWHLEPMAAFDLETTGPDPETARIVSAALVKVGVGHTTDNQIWMLDPGVEIPTGATAVHGITTKIAQTEGMRAAVGVELIAEAVAAVLPWTPLVIFNASYDLTVLDRECRRYELPTLAERISDPPSQTAPICPVVDPFVLDKWIDTYRKGSRKLVDVCRHYNVRLDGAHDSGFDALAAARVAYRIGERSHLGTSKLKALGCTARVIDQYRKLAGLDIVGLHDAQVHAKREQDRSLAAHFRKKAGQARTADQQVELWEKAESCTGHWPVRPVPEAVSR